MEKTEIEKTEIEKPYMTSGNALGAGCVEGKYMNVEDEIIAKVADIRKSNNDCWMRLLRLALKSSPEEARKIIADITKNDKQVTEWLSRL